jgi:hypothetical protein
MPSALTIGIYTFKDKIKENEMGRAFITYWGETRVLVGRLKGRRPLGGPKLRWEDDIKMYL